MRSCLPFGTRLVAAAFLLAAAASPLAAQEGSLFEDPDEKQERLEPPPSLPEGLRGTIRRQRNDAAAPSARQINRLSELFQAIQACWQLPAGSGFSGQEVTLRLSFKSNGEILGKPRITYYKAGTEADRREPFTRSVREAFERCTPLPFTESFGRAIAGRIFSFRFIDAQPM